MKHVLRFALLIWVLSVFFSSGWVCYSADKECPWPPPEKSSKMLSKEKFLSAHGLTQANFSIWLREHTAWRKQFSEDLKAYTFLPQDYDTNRR